LSPGQAPAASVKVSVTCPVCGLAQFTSLAVWVASFRGKSMHCRGLSSDHRRTPVSRSSSGAVSLTPLCAMIPQRTRRSPGARVSRGGWITSSVLFSMGERVPNRARSRRAQPSWAIRSVSVPGRAPSGSGKAVISCASCGPVQDAFLGPVVRSPGMS
jgi:hypothetical protein